MSYADEYALASDSDYRGRVTACIVTEATGRGADELAHAVLRNPTYTVGMFMPFLSTAPGFGDEYAAGGQESIADPEILASVQANWDTVAAINAPDVAP